MNLYEEIKKGMTNINSVDTSANDLENAYEEFYTIVTRLQDMDGLDENGFAITKGMLEKGIPFKDALIEGLSQSYGEVDVDTKTYFTNTLDYLEKDLETIINSSNSVDVWVDKIRELEKIVTYNLNGKDYSLEELRQKVEREAE